MRIAPTGADGQLVGSLSVMPKNDAGTRGVAALAGVAGSRPSVRPAARAEAPTRARTVRRERVIRWITPMVSTVSDRAAAARHAVRPRTTAGVAWFTRLDH